MTFSAALTVDNGTLVRKATKTGVTKIVALDAATTAMVRSWRARTIEVYLGHGWPWTEDSPVWRQRGRRTPIYPDTISQTWRTLADELGLARVRFHDIRHTTISALVAAGRDPRRVADRVGHASPTMTLDWYSHGDPASSAEDAAYIATQLHS